LNPHLALADKHVTALGKWNARCTDDHKIIHELDIYFASSPDLAGGTTERLARLYRYRVTENLMYAGIEIEKADLIRTLLERSDQPMTSSTHLRDFIPVIESKEFDQLVADFVSEFVSGQFDATYRQGDAVSYLLKCCTADFHLQQRLVAFMTALKHWNGLDMASFITQHTVGRLLISLKNMMSFSRDSVAANGVTMRSLLTTFTNSDDIHCAPHLLSNTGEHFELETADTFFKPWVTLVYSSAAAKKLWETLIGEAVVGWSNIRWYAKGEILIQIGRNFHHLENYLKLLCTRGIGDATTKEMTRVYDSSELELKIDLAGMMDVKIIIETTHKLEGDGVEIAVAFRYLEALRAMGRALDSEGSLPNVESVLRASAELKKGLVISKVWPGHGSCLAKVVKLDTAASTLYPGQERTVYKIKYDNDGQTEELEEEELRPLIVTINMAERAALVASLRAGFTYLEDRLTGQCTATYGHVTRTRAPSLPKRAPRACHMSGGT
jgi:hypothetical protein